MASRWFPPSRQGLALGIAGAGNSGTVLATFFAPRIAVVLGWQRTMALTLLPLLLMALVWTALAKDSPVKVAPSRFGEVLGKADFWLLALVYSVTFGGFVGLTSFLPIFLNGEYHLKAVVAGTITAVAAFMGSAARPLGGYVADRVGGRAAGMVVLTVVALSAVAVGAHAGIVVTSAALFVLLAGLGAGNGSVFQMVPRRFPREIAVVTGLVGAAGGLGGFFLPTMLGSIKQATGSFTLGFAVFATMALGAVAILLVAGRAWVRTWLVTAAATRPVAAPEMAYGEAVA
jgi:NNP family nitrate/nitrite transporter-like MFS transporter